MIRSTKHPEFLSIELSSACNLDCPLCAKGRNEICRSEDFIELDLFERICREVKDYECLLNLWNYGEPLLHPNFIELCKILKKHALKSVISTNGTVMNPKIARALLTSNFSEIYVGIDGIDPQSYEKYRVGSNFSLVLKNLRLLTQVKKQLKNDTTKIIVQFIVFRHNIHQIPHLKSFFKKYDVDDIKIKSAYLGLPKSSFASKFQPKSSVDSGKKANLNPVEVARKYLDLRYQGERYEIKGDLIRQKGIRLSGCPLVQYSFVINSDASVVPCCWDVYSEYDFGTIRTHTVQEIWESNARKNFLENYEKTVNPWFCDNCPIKYSRDFTLNLNQFPKI